MPEKISLNTPNWLLVLELAVLVAVIIIAGRSVQRRSSVRSSLIRGLGALVVTQVIFWIVASVQLLTTYRQSSLGKYLLPPHSPVLLQRMSSNLVVIISGWVAVAIFSLLVITWIKKHPQQEMIDERDVAALMIGSAAVGWPAIFIFLAGTFFLSVMGLVFLIIIRRRNIRDRIVLTPYIIPAAVLTLVFRAQLLSLTHLLRIQF